MKNAKELEEYRFWGVANVNAMSIDKMTHEFAQKIDEIANMVGCIEDQLGIMASNMDDGFKRESCYKRRAPRYLEDADDDVVDKRISQLMRDGAAMGILSLLAGLWLFMLMLRTRT